MSHAMLARDLGPISGATRRAFFKRDHPRAIDQYINYFGGDATVADPCGEALLEALESRERPGAEP